MDEWDSKRISRFGQLFSCHLAECDNNRRLIIRVAQMQVTLLLNLSDTLSAQELKDLAKIAEAQGKSIERVLFEAAKALLSRMGSSHRAGKAEGRGAA